MSQKSKRQKPSTPSSVDSSSKKKPTRKSSNNSPLADLTTDFGNESTMAEVESEKSEPPTQKIETPKTQKTNDENRISNGSTRRSLYLEASFASTSKSITKSNNKTSAATSLTKKRTERLRSMTTDAGGENLVSSSSSVTSTRKSQSNSSMSVPFGDKTNDIPTTTKSVSDEKCSLDNGFQRGLKPEKIVELEEKDGERKFLIKWIGSHSSEYGNT